MVPRPIAPAAVERLVAEFGQIFIQGYAASEVLNWVSILNKADHRTDTGAARRRLASAGRVSPGVEIMIVGDDGEPQPTGAAGEIWLRTRGTIDGYLHNQEFYERGVLRRVLEIRRSRLRRRGRPSVHHRP